MRKVLCICCCISMLIFTACDQDAFRKSYSKTLGISAGATVSAVVLFSLLAILEIVVENTTNCCESNNKCWKF